MPGLLGTTLPVGPLPALGAPVPAGFPAAGSVPALPALPGASAPALPITLSLPRFTFDSVAGAQLCADQANRHNEAAARRDLRKCVITHTD
jgi:hypothetical protein